MSAAPLFDVAEKMTHVRLLLPSKDGQWQEI